MIKSPLMKKINTSKEFDMLQT